MNAPHSITARPPAPRAALAALTLSTLAASLGVSVATVALPALAADLGATLGGAQWAMLAYLLTLAAAVVPAGRLGDMAGRRRVLLAGLALFALGGVLAGLAPGVATLAAARALQGVGGAAMTALSLSAARDAAAPERLGRAMGALGAASAFGTALGPSLGGLLVAGFGWRAAFLALAPLGGLAFALAWRALPESGRAKAPGRFDLAGAALLAAILAA